MRALVAAGSLAAGRSLVDRLRSGGHQAVVADTGQEALALVRLDEYDVVVIGLDLPDMRGVDLVRSLRDMGGHQSVLVLSPAPQAVARIAVLAAGADDVMALPLDEDELDARLQALVRRSRGHSQQVLSAGAVTINLDTHGVTVNGRPVKLTAKERAVLELLMLRRGVPVTKDTFLRQLYADGDQEPESRVIDVFIFKVRSKLAAAGASNIIETVRGRGYMVRGSRAQEKVQPQPSGAPVRGGPVHQKA